jgi:hypothetical protein
LNDVREDELVAESGHRADVLRLRGVIAERPAQRPHRLAEGAVGDHHVAPDGVENLPPADRLVAPSDQQQEQIEIARDEGDFAARPVQHAPGRRQDELAEDVAFAHGVSEIELPHRPAALLNRQLLLLQGRPYSRNLEPSRRAAGRPGERSRSIVFQTAANLPT